jgi:hypothetical protein
MSRANSPKKYRYHMFWLATETACVLDWLMVVTVDGVMAMKIKHFPNSIPAFVKHLRPFGEAGVVTIAGTIKKKVDMRGLLCLGVVTALTGLEIVTKCMILLITMYTLHVMFFG